MDKAKDGQVNMKTDGEDASKSMPHLGGGRSRSVNTPTAANSTDFSDRFRTAHHSSSSQFSPDSTSAINIQNCCKNELELRDRVLSSKRILLRNFFSYYIKSLMMVNEKLNLSYLTKLKKEYMKLKETDKITVSELQEAVDEMMEVDEQSKTHLFQILSEQTNLRDILMTSTSTSEETTA